MTGEAVSAASTLTRQARPLPSREELVELLDYDPATGIFQWKPRRELNKCILARGVAGTLRAGYRDICFQRRHYGAHRLAWKYVYGTDPVGEIDHINGVRTDNRIANLRCVTSAENRRNAAAPRTNTSGHVGVHFKTEKGKWLAYMSLGGRFHHLGYSDTKEGAIALREAAEREHGFHPNHGRAQCSA